jgi:D-arabinose 1-dehydrogenase-like Zn-dependent alcohol dehydrogenase
VYVHDTDRGDCPVRAAVVESRDAAVQFVERARPDPGPDTVRVEVAACGVCGGDLAVLDGAPGVEYPRIPGHEVAGRVDAVGERVTRWSPGDRVAVGWHGGHCFGCEQCRHGRFTTCEHKRVTGLTRDGGFAEYTLVRPEALIPVPDEVSAAHAGPLVCAGLTAYNVLRNSDTCPGDLVAVQGIGGVGHMGVQFAAAMGYETVALSRGTGKREAALELGADEFVDTSRTDPDTALRERGGADAVLATAPSAAAIEAVVDGLAPEGELLTVAAPEESVELAVGPMLDRRLTVRGWSAGHPGDASDTLELAVARDIRPRVERHPLADLERAVARLQESETRFRAVVEP